MLFPYTELALDDKTWRRINMRKVSHLIGAEMIHNLYDRHWPRINSLRFRHTITNFKGGIVESYAPVNEWAYLQHWLSKKFASLDPILIREIRDIMNPTYALVDEIIERVDKADLGNIDNQELALLLIDIMDYPLGEIYKLNVVQIEYSLNFALHNLLEKYEPNVTDRNELLAQLISPGKLTVAQEEEVAFGEVMTAGRTRKVADPKIDAALMQLIEDHYDRYAATHCAYGEEPPLLDDYINKYVFLYQQNKPPVSKEEAEKNVLRQLERSKKLLAKLNDDNLTCLCELMADIGVFRDHNKAKLGETVIRRLRILDEISRRTKVPRNDINYFLMAELTTLLDTDKKITADILADRKKNGVSFVRSEEVYSDTRAIKHSSDDKDENILPGICASPGEVTADAKIIRTKEDIVKVNPGDIMVAVGTDFDLLEIMNISGGIITEEGGLLSHASVVSRELKKPCLIGVPNATTLLQDGDKLYLEATAGRLTILQSHKDAKRK